MSILNNQQKKKADNSNLHSDITAKPDLIDYLISLPDVEDPYAPIQKNEPQAIIAEQTSIQLLVEEIRLRSQEEKLISKQEIMHSHQQCNELLSVFPDTADYSDIHYVSGNKDQYYYSTRYMTDNYAKIAMLVLEKDLPRTIAQMVRFNCKTYPAVTPFSYFERHPYYYTQSQIERAWLEILRNGQYGDVKSIEAENGVPYMYSTLFFTARYARALADDCEADPQ